MRLTTLYINGLIKELIKYKRFQILPNENPTLCSNIGIQDNKKTIVMINNTDIFLYAAVTFVVGFAVPDVSVCDVTLASVLTVAAMFESA